MKRTDFIKSLLALGTIPRIANKQTKQYERIYLLQTFVRGFQYYDGPKIIEQLNKMQQLALVREYDNEYDKFAIALYSNNNKIGFVPAEINEILAKIIDADLLLLHAEINHIELNANDWQKIHFVIYALKEIKSKQIPENARYLTLLETPDYISLKMENNKYYRFYLD